MNSDKTAQNRGLLICAALAIIALILGGSTALSAQLRPETVRAWDQYLQWADQKVRRELASPDRFMIEDSMAAADKAEVQRRLGAGQSVIGQMSGVIPPGSHFEVPGGEVHHWWGAILIPKTTLPALMKFLQDYDHHAGRFSDVEQSRLLASDGSRFRFVFRLKRSKSFVTAYYNTVQECVYTKWDSNRMSSRSDAARIAEIEDAGTPNERELEPGNDRGFLWRLVSWWRFQQTDKGVIVELESASLSRNIPAFVRFIPGVSSYIRSTPRESIESILTRIRNHFIGG